MTRLVLLLAIVLSACAKHSPPPAEPSPTPSEPQAARTVTIKHGPITWVMDTPSNQMEKAQHEIEKSPLMGSLQAMGVTIEWAEDPELTDKATVIADGTELGSADIRELGNKDSGEADRLTGLVKDHFKL